MTPEDMIYDATAQFIHKTIYYNQPDDIINLFKRPVSNRITDIYNVYHPRTVKYGRQMIKKCISLYNDMPDDMKLMPPKKLRYEMKQGRSIKKSHP